MDAGAEVLRCDRPGLGRARNVGLSAIDEEFVAFTDDDCLADSHWLETLVAALERPDGPGFVTGQVRSDVEVHRRAWLPVSVTDATEPRPLRYGDDPRAFGHGANMGWTRAALDRIGGFDDWLGVGSPLRAAEDVDAWSRAVEDGIAGWYAPDAVVVHRQWRSRKDMLRTYFGYGVGAGALAVKRYRSAPAGRRGGARRRLAHALLVEDGPGRVFRSLARGYHMAAVADALLFLGAQRGALRARGYAVSEGHFQDSTGTP